MAGSMMIMAPDGVFHVCKFSGAAVDRERYEGQCALLCLAAGGHGSGGCVVQ